MSIKLKVPVVLKIKEVNNFELSDELFETIKMIRKLPYQMIGVLLSDNTEWDQDHFIKFTEDINERLNDFGFYNFKEHELSFRCVLKYLTFVDESENLNKIIDFDFSIIDDYYLSSSINVDIESFLLEPIIKMYMNNEDISKEAYDMIESTIVSSIKNSDMFSVEDVFLDEMEILK